MRDVLLGMAIDLFVTSEFTLHAHNNVADVGAHVDFCTPPFKLIGVFAEGMTSGDGLSMVMVGMENEDL